MSLVSVDFSSSDCEEDDDRLYTDVTSDSSTDGLLGIEDECDSIDDALHEFSAEGNMLECINCHRCQNRGGSGQTFAIEELWLWEICKTQSWMMFRKSCFDGEKRHVFCEECAICT